EIAQDGALALASHAGDGHLDLVGEFFEVCRFEAELVCAGCYVLVAGTQGDGDRRPVAIARAAGLLSAGADGQADTDALDAWRGVRQENERAEEQGQQGERGWPSGNQGFASLQTQGVWRHLGQPWPYLASRAASRSMAAMLARVASQARTSANSAARWSFGPERREADSSPTSSMN